MTDHNIKPATLSDSHLIYLDELRESGETNMFGAAIYLQQVFDMTKSEAREILKYWMATSEERHA